MFSKLIRNDRLDDQALPELRIHLSFSPHLTASRGLMVSPDKTFGNKSSIKLCNLSIFGFPAFGINEKYSFNSLFIILVLKVSGSHPTNCVQVTCLDVGAHQSICLEIHFSTSTNPDSGLNRKVSIPASRDASTFFSRSSTNKISSNSQPQLRIRIS